MKGNKLKISLLGIIVIGVLASTGFAMFLSNSGLGPKINVAVYATGTPDSYGNYIAYVAFFQNASGSWTGTTAVYNTTYTAGTNVTITANTATIMTVYIHLNSSLASSFSDAATKTRIYINITGVVTNGAFIYTSAAPGSWDLLYSYPSTLASPTSVWTPAASTNYNLTILYQAYY